MEQAAIALDGDAGLSPRLDPCLDLKAVTLLLRSFLFFIFIRLQHVSPVIASNFVIIHDK